MKQIALALVAVLWLVTPAHAQENPQIGTIAEVEGNVTLTHGVSTPIVAQVNDPVFLDDQIGTGAASRTHILFIDETEVTLGENATFSAEDYAFDEKDPSVGKARYSALRGSFIYVGGLIDKNPHPDVNVQTAYGTIGMRGTTVWGGYMDDAYGVFTADGSVSVKTEGGEVIVNKGEGTDVRSRGVLPTRPALWKEARVGRAKKMIAMKNMKAVQARIATMKVAQATRRAQFGEIMRERAQKRQNPSPQQKQQLQQKIEQQKQKLQNQQERTEQLQKNKADRLQQMKQLQEQRQGNQQNQQLKLQQQQHLEQQKRLRPNRIR